jgi:hypothetical protein
MGISISIYRYVVLLNSKLTRFSSTLFFSPSCVKSWMTDTGRVVPAMHVDGTLHTCKRKGEGRGEKGEGER